MNYEELNGRSIREGFNIFDKENPEIYQTFEREALHALHKGRKKLSAKLLINWIRWNYFISGSKKNFKINDAYQAYFARKFVNKYPQYRDAFEFRKLRNEQQGPYITVDGSGQLSFL